MRKLIISLAAAAIAGRAVAATPALARSAPAHVAAVVWHPGDRCHGSCEHQ